MKQHWFHHHASIVEKAIEILHLPHKKTRAEKWLEWVQLLLLYSSLFVAGYLVARVQMLGS